MNSKTATACLVLASLLAGAAAIAAPKSFEDQLREYRERRNGLTEVDPAIEAIARSARKNHARFEQIKHTMKKWSPHTNVVARLARQSTMEKLTAERDIAKWTRKAAKDAEQAEKHDKKNFDNWLKDTIKAHDKSSEAMHPFYDDIIFFATNRIPEVATR